MYFAAGKQDTGKRKGLTMLTVVGVIITGALGETFFLLPRSPAIRGLSRVTATGARGIWEQT